MWLKLLCKLWNILHLSPKEGTMWYTVSFFVLHFVKKFNQAWNFIKLLMSTHVTNHFFYCFIQLDSLLTRASDNCENTFLGFLSHFKRGWLILLCSSWYIIRHPQYVIALEMHIFSYRCVLFSFLKNFLFDGHLDVMREVDFISK